MTIANTVRKAGPFTCNGATTVFPFTFKVFATNEVVVSLTDSTGVTTTLALTSGYTVSLNVNQDVSPGGTITTNLIYATGYLLTLTSSVASTQQVVLTNTGGFYPDVLNAEFDRLTILIQQLAEVSSRTLVFPISDLANAPLPPAAQRIGKYLAFDPTGAPIIASGVGTDAAMRTDLAASTGASLIGIIRGAIGAVIRTMSSKALELISVKDFGAAVDGVTDDTAAFNLATQASAVASSALYISVSIPSGTSVLGASNGTVYVRKGQRLYGQGMGATSLNVSSRVANTAPIIVLGKKSDGTVDAGGQPVEVSNLFTLGGPGAVAVVDATAPAGWSVHDCFISSPGVGLAAGGSDGLVHGNFFEQGLNLIVVTGANIKLTNNLYYLSNYQITLNTGAYDTLIADSQFEYFTYTAILLNTGATGLGNIQVRGCNFIQNQQFATAEGAISLRSTGADIYIGGCTFRNLYGSGVIIFDGSSTVIIENCIFDGNRSAAAYNQSTTMAGVTINAGTRVVIRNCEFRNLPGQPITFGGVYLEDIVIANCTFTGNTGGTAEVSVTNVNASRLTMIGCKGSGRTLVSTSATVLVKLIDCDDGVAGIAAVASAAALTLPVDKSVISITGTTTVTSINTTAADRGRVVTLVFAGILTFTKGGNLKIATTYVTAANGTILLSCDGTSWYETGRSVN